MQLLVVLARCGVGLIGGVLLGLLRAPIVCLLQVLITLHPDLSLL